MPRAIVSAIVATVLGAVAGAVVLAAVYSTRAEVLLEMDRDLPAFASGFYGVERSGEDTFAWTSDRAVVRLAGLDRRVGWTCNLRVRGARDTSLELPQLTLSVDGAVSRTAQLNNDFVEIGIDAPPRPGRPGLTLTAMAAPTFVPGPGDRRVLGAQVDWLRCVPAGRVWPSSRALVTAASSAGIFAFIGAVAGMPMAALAILAAIVALGQALLLSTGGGTFGGYPDLMLRLAVGAGVAGLVTLFAPRLWRRTPLSPAAIGAIICSSAIGFLKLAALSHPVKPLVDAVFQAHRLEWVAQGRYFFTQPLPDGVEFPYAIGLYVMALPWVSLVTDHVLLLRMVVLVFEAAAGLFLYAVVSRQWNDRLAGVFAVVLFHLVPLPYVVIGNANLTNAFAQAVAVIVMVLVVSWPAEGRRVAAFAALTAVTAGAFLSHVSTLMMLGATLATVVVVYLLFGARADRRLAGALVVSTGLALVVATGLYYRHFPDVYTQFVSRVRAQDVAIAAPVVEISDAPAVLVRALTRRERAAHAARQTTSGVGWPVLVLAMAGAWRLVTRGSRDRLSLLLAGWVCAWIVLLFAGTMTRVDTAYQRYAAEFLGRVNLASYPAAVVLAALGVSTFWTSRPRLWRALGVCLCGAAAALGVGAWWRWVN